MVSSVSARIAQEAPKQTGPNGAAQGKTGVSKCDEQPKFKWVDIQQNKSNNKVACNKPAVGNTSSSDNGPNGSAPKAQIMAPKNPVPGAVIQVPNKGASTSTGNVTVGRSESQAFGWVHGDESTKSSDGVERKNSFIGFGGMSTTNGDNNSSIIVGRVNTSALGTGSEIVAKSDSVTSKVTPDKGDKALAIANDVDLGPISIGFGSTLTQRGEDFKTSKSFGITFFGNQIFAGQTPEITVHPWLVPDNQEEAVAQP